VIPIPTWIAPRTTGTSGPLFPEALHQVTINKSDRGIPFPYSYRRMLGYGKHTFSLINVRNERFYVKFHLKTQEGINTSKTTLVRVKIVVALFFVPS